MEGKRQAPGAARRRGRLAGALLAVAVIAVVVVVPQAPAHVTRDIPHVLEHVLEAISGVQETADAIEAKTAAMPVVVTDTFHEQSGAGGDGFVGQEVAALEGKEFLANITVHCTFAAPDNSTAKNIAIVSARLKTPTGSGGFLTTFSEESTDRIVTLVTGPFAGFDGEATYFVSCIPGGGNTFSQAMGQAWFEVVP